MKQFTILILIVLFSMSMVYSQQDTLIYKYRRMSVDYQQQIKMAEADLVEQGPLLLKTR